MQESKISNFSPEDTAFICQQIEELRDYLSPAGQIVVREVQTNSKANPFALMITITENDAVVLKMKFRDKSIAEAMMQGKNQIRKFLDEVIDESISTASRQAEINALMNNTSTKH